MLGKQGHPVKEFHVSRATVRNEVVPLAADDQSFNHSGVSQLGSDDAMATIFNIVATVDTMPKNNAHHLLTAFDVLPHLLNLTVVALHELAPGRIGNVDFIEGNENGALIAPDLAVGATLVGLAHDASVRRGFRVKRQKKDQPQENLPTAGSTPEVVHNFLLEPEPLP